MDTKFISFFFFFSFSFSFFFFFFLNVSLSCCYLNFRSLFGWMDFGSCTSFPSRRRAWLWRRIFPFSARHISIRKRKESQKIPKNPNQSLRIHRLWRATWRIASKCRMILKDLEWILSWCLDSLRISKKSPKILNQIKKNTFRIFVPDSSWFVLYLFFWRTTAPCTW